MKKEVILAITIGFILGLIITGGIWIANRSLRNQPQTADSASPTVVPNNPQTNTTPAPTSASGNSPATAVSSLSISSPSDEALVNSGTLTVKGKAPAGSTVAVLYELGEQVVTADAGGDFSADISLEGGYNMITVTAVSADGTQSSQNLTVTYTTNKI